MDKKEAALIVAKITSNLTFLANDCRNRLDSVRRVIGYNLLNGRQDLSAINLHAFGYEPSEEEIVEFEKYIVDELNQEDMFLVKRVNDEDIIPTVGIRLNEISLPVDTLSASAEQRWNQKKGEEYGPYVISEGVSIWFDFYYYEDKLTVRSKTGNVSHFLFSNAVRSIWQDILNNSQTVNLNAGHAWIAARLFNQSARVDEYVGFKIKNGTFSISNEKEWNDQFLDYQGNFTGSLTLELEQPEENESVFEGCKAAQSIKFKYPDKVTFEWQEGVLVNILSDSGSFEGYNNQLTLSEFALPISYDNRLNLILIPCKTEPPVWEADFSQSQIFDTQGTAEIEQSYWALPLARVSNPSTLTEPENNGAWALKLSSDLTSKWVGTDAQQPDAIPGNTMLLLYPNALFLYSDQTTVDVTFTESIQQNFLTWSVSSENPARIPFRFHYQDKFLLAYYCHATEGELVMANCFGNIQPDRPIYAEGSPLQMQDNMAGNVFFQARGSEVKIVALLKEQINSDENLQRTPRPIALQNALISVYKPSAVVLQGNLLKTNPNQIQSGGVVFLQNIARWKPILPDPYVSNLQDAWGSVRDGNPTGISAHQISSALYALIQWETPESPTLSYTGNLPIFLGVGIKPASDAQIKSLPVKLSPKELRKIGQNAINDKKNVEKEKQEQIFDELEKRLIGWKLLDVSTNMDLIGVSVSPYLFRQRDRHSHLSSVTSDQSQLVRAYKNVGEGMVLKEMATHTPLSMVHVFTLPQVQWEPVRTLPEDQDFDALGWFPENLSSASDGGATRLIGVSKKLTPVIPDLVADHIQETFNTGSQTVARTTLSFGLKTYFLISPKDASNRNADSLDVIRPEFPQKEMTGGIQVNLMAESGNPKFKSPSPGFKGIMSQTLNGYELFTGTEMGLSVLGATLRPDASVESQFNKEFSVGGNSPIVPVTRFDLSGYGGSNFSEWDNDRALASIGKVQFKIMVGRTAFEIVKFVSKIYPWGTTVTRSVTIERRSGGGIVRKDSGWQATEAGVFNFILKEEPHVPADNPYKFRPGLFQGCFDLKNIRPASNDIIKYTDPANGNQVELAPVYFDANINLENQVEDSILSRGILGFIQLEPKPDINTNPWTPRLLSPVALQKLIQDQGAIGGPIDTLVNVGNSNFMLRATRFEVDVTMNGTTPNFVGIVRGQPILPGNGSWSVVKIASPGNTTDPQEATSSDIDKGTPVFIENSWITPSVDRLDVSPSTGPYRFLDPADLFVTQPRYDYGFMQNTGSQAFLFRRPVIAQGSKEISSGNDLKPAFADPFALMTSKGVFPPIANAVELPTANYKLQTQAGTSKLRLHPSVDYNNLRLPLVLTQDGVDQITIEYDQSRLRIDLNFDDWNVELDNFFIWTSLMGISKFSGTRYSLRAGSNQTPKLVQVRSLLKPEIQDALRFLPGMGSPQDVGDIDLGMTNAKHEIKIHSGFECKFDFQKGKIECKPDFLGGDVFKQTDGNSFSSTSALWLKLKASTGVDSVLDTSTVAGWEAFFGATFGAELQGRIPLGGIFFLVLGLELEVALRSSASPTTTTSPGFKSLEISAYVGFGVGGSIGPFSASAFLAVGVVFVYEDDTAKLGGLVRLEGEVDLKVVTVNLKAELQGVIYDGDDPDTAPVETDVRLCDATGSVAVNVSILFLINIKASYSYKTTKRL